MPDKYLISLTHFPKFGPASLAKLKALGSWQAAWQATASQLGNLSLPPAVISEFISWRAQNNPEKFLDTMNQHSIKTLELTDADYPLLLKNIYQPPPLLYYQGSLNPEIYNLTLAVVGSRRPTAYGQMAVNALAKKLAAAGLTIASGLAIGIDTLAHRAALAEKKLTIAVLGSGLARSVLYPRTNCRLADEIIAAGGLLISEFPPLAPAALFNFPRRNRLISGLSLGVLVIEAAAKSGSLITAHYGLEQGREVWAVPGNIFSDQSAGTNHLIKLGAKPATKFEDILDSLNLPLAAAAIDPAAELDGAEALIIRALTAEAQHAEDLTRLLNLEISVITSTLTILEIKGLVKNLGNLTFIRL